MIEAGGFAGFSLPLDPRMNACALPGSNELLTERV